MGATPDRPDVHEPPDALGRSVGRRASTSRRFGIAAAAGVGGTVLHDLVEFGRPAIENSGVVALVLVAGALAWTAMPTYRRIVRGSLLAFVWVALLGGAIASVLPLPIWPFEPDQGPLHYLVHAVWAGALGVTVVMLRRLPA